ncbi:cytochrome C, partial [Dissulfurirhabdus thermomarina]|nr:cytochrome C [Dissulfurirhabdus thermomarina]
YDPDIASDCYRCHPGNNVNCFRGHHTGKTIDGHPVWCTDCHGDLNQRVAEGQLLDPWSDRTLPTCSKCHSSTGEGDAKGYLNMGIFGQYLNSRGHRNDKILCSTCHGEPHALYPSTLPADNAQIEALQNDPRPIGVCDTCHTGKSSTWGKPPH